eukprot:Gregarina_sp_Poly_1__866@NODE_1207_length_4783_cov_48_825700_g827_i0_p4_GENE_NODE_1207_length_4783_cov_48_825700_g827_i0NODE_1207_length_4783_cov_48_825700_g827_i0_p4_ORF_typecomplete_len224_score30_51_NODE_1207_length_4783_cov_48_825700_g827_i022852956
MAPVVVGTTSVGMAVVAIIVVASIPVVEAISSLLIKVDCDIVVSDAVVAIVDDVRDSHIPNSDVAAMDDDDDDVVDCGVATPDAVFVIIDDIVDSDITASDVVVMVVDVVGSDIAGLDVRGDIIVDVAGFESVDSDVVAAKGITGSKALASTAGSTNGGIIDEIVTSEGGGSISDVFGCDVADLNSVISAAVRLIVGAGLVSGKAVEKAVIVIVLGAEVDLGE